MSLLNNLLRKTKIQNRLFAGFIITCIIPLILLSVFSYTSFSQITKKRVSQSTMESLRLIHRNIESRLEWYQYLCGRVSIEPVVQNNLRTFNPHVSVETRESIALSMMDLIREKLVYPTRMQNIIITDTAGNIFYDMGYDILSRDMLSGLLDVIDKRTPEDSWAHITVYGNGNRVVLGRRVNNTRNINQQLGYALLFIDERLFTTDLLGNIDLGGNSDILILDKEGKVMTANRKNIVRNNEYSTEISRELAERKDVFFAGGQTALTVGGQESLVSYVYSPAIAHYIVSVIPQTYITSEINRVAFGTILLIGCILLLCVAIILLLYYSILKPIRSSVAACKSIAAGNLDARIQDKGNDEIAYLSANIDNTIEAMRDMLYQQKRDSEKQRELEIEVLRYQINPHFLLNTLGTLKWMAVVHDVPVLDEITSALGKILENTLVDKRKFIPLSEEMDTLKEYVLIQKARYAEKFESVFDIQTEAAILPIPKFILQPLMENAILHGAYDNGRVILIEVSAAIRGNILRVEINDNGRGFDPNNMTRTGRGSIGIANVRQRLMSIYGHGAELIIESRPEHGTCCVLKMPLAKPEEII